MTKYMHALAACAQTHREMLLRLVGELGMILLAIECVIVVVVVVVVAVVVLADTLQQRNAREHLLRFVDSSQQCSTRVRACVVFC